MIVVALGGNLPSRYGGPRETIEAALAELARRAIRPVRSSPFYRSAPVPASSQPDYVNAVAEIATTLAPASLLDVLHQIEYDFGRRRALLNEARILDLDLIDYHGIVSVPGAVPELPHPRMHERTFVLIPLVALAPDWRHPVSGLTAAELLAALPATAREACHLDR
ncbi:MAG: 2-amino-4-hydroxy-6-hydroxymethyldihydropteridine diphosphokinase [Proteobacteria bacterium]|nr:2-amino-4-hydroxy-6-hydroxymethyldihydropteridine diphosphokinase [Pseudomonadota bacterium]MBI3497159.1 2-amino-4-hydroxy-6-hydroxymethyldihydropteridine diphosphokinase [Pseudomonadota bacterium]